jgi:spore_sigmaK: RNA polymerase sigma-K factor
VEDCFQKDSISHLLSHIPQILTQKEYEVICCRYGLNGQDPLTQREIARNLSISRSYVSRIEKNALRKLRTLFPEKQ